MNDFEGYLSPFSWRYGSQEMRHLWSETYKRKLWRQIWVALAEVEEQYGLVRPEQVEDLRSHMDEVDIERSLEVEAEIQHDLMAEIKVFAAQCPIGGGIIHLGATSADIEDNVDALRLRQSLDLLIDEVKAVLTAMAGLIEKHASTVVMGFTHLQPAEPTTLGYRLALYGQDLLSDLETLKELRNGIKGKGFKGAVGTGAPYTELVGAEALEGFEEKLSRKLDLPFFDITAQVYPRGQDYRFVSALAGMGASLYKFAFDLRLLQSPTIGELNEPFGERQVGSSAMPFKRNPIRAEKIDSLARALAGMPRLAWDNAAHSLLERTLDDSADRRSLLPEACLAADEILKTAESILTGLRVNEAAIRRNLATYGPFAATERVLAQLVKAGADRQVMHERIRQHAMQAWQAVQQGEANPLAGLLFADVEITRLLPEERIRSLMNAEDYVGDAPIRALRLAQKIREAL